MVLWIQTALCDVIQNLETEDATWSIFSALLGTTWLYAFSQDENASVDKYFTRP